MMRASAVLLLALLLTACSRPPASPGEPLGNPPPGNVPVADAQPFVGTWYEWPPAGDLGDIVLRIDGKTMVANSDCATMAWTYRRIDARLDIARAPVSSCVRGLTAREERFNKALDSATRALNRGRELIIEGPGGRIVLHDRPSESR